MSVDHKRPLLAFAVVTIACVVILVNAVRSEAFVSLLRAETSHVVAGLGLAPADHRPGHRLGREPEAARLVDVPVVVAPLREAHPARPRAHQAPAALRGVPPRAHGEPGLRAHKDHAHGHGEHARRHAREHGHHHGHADHALGDHGPEGGDAGDGHANARELGHSPTAALRR